jgi:hypothetical protein
MTVPETRLLAEPEAAALRDKIKLLIGGGHEFIPVRRPKGYRKRKDKECFGNAVDLALDERGKYVEGFAMTDLGLAVHHAWVTLDGVHAIETTWHEPGLFYFGIEYDNKAVARRVLAKPFDGYAQLDPAEPLIDARLLLRRAA